MPVRWPTAGEMMTSEPETVAHDAPVSQAIGLMRAGGFHELPVVRRSKLIGLLTFETIARRSSLSLSTKVEHLLLLPPLLAPNTPFPEIAEQLLAAGIRAAPVVGRRGELLGVVSRTDLVRELPETLPLSGRTVDELARSVGTTIRETDTVRVLMARLRLLEEHPLPVIDRRGQLVGAIGLADLGRVLWRPMAGGKKDVYTRGSIQNVTVGTFMRSPPITVREGSSVTDAARLMTRERVTSVFVVDAKGRPTTIVGQTDLLGLAVGGRPSGGRSLGDVYVEITGLRGASDPAVLTEIDHVVAKSLRRIARYVHPTLLNLHFSPHATHRGGDVTIESRLHSERGIFYSSQTGWNFIAGVTDVMDELTSQVRRSHEEARRPRRSGRGRPVLPDTSMIDPDLETRIRTATEEDGG